MRHRRIVQAPRKFGSKIRRLRQPLALLMGRFSSCKKPHRQGFDCRWGESTGKDGVTGAMEELKEVKRVA
jgi:hypothetical protein